MERGTLKLANREYGARCFAYGYIFAGGKADDAQRIVAAIFDMDEKAAAECAASAIGHLAKLLMGEEENSDQY